MTGETKEVGKSRGSLFAVLIMMPFVVITLVVSLFFIFFAYGLKDSGGDWDSFVGSVTVVGILFFAVLLCLFGVLMGRLFRRGAGVFALIFGLMFSFGVLPWLARAYPGGTATSSAMSRTGAS